MKGHKHHYKDSLLLGHKAGGPLKEFEINGSLRGDGLLGGEKMQESHAREARRGQVLCSGSRPGQVDPFLNNECLCVMSYDVPYSEVVEDNHAAATECDFSSLAPKGGVACPHGWEARNGNQAPGPCSGIIENLKERHMVDGQDQGTEADGLLESFMNWDKQGG
ncbi:hypothetical protein AHAS_Ahas02G0190000 [Arachis hypogaea]